MMKKNYLLLTLFFTITFCYSQKKEIDSIPFSLEKQLLTFSGKVNGKTIEFALDTGAAVSVSNSINNKTAGVEILDSNKTINDSSNKKIKIKSTKIESLSIGNFEVKNLKGVTFDMPFLYCTNLLLLGQDFIKKFNWKIDFTKKLIYISEKPFPTDQSYQKWTVYYHSNRPLIDFTIQNKTFKNCLLDTGFSGVMEINSKDTDIMNTIFDEKKSKNQADEFISTNMGLSGLGNPESYSTFFVDEIKKYDLPITGKKISEANRNLEKTSY
jgi:predicted aspartyl protease